MAEQFANNAASTLNGAINDSTTTIVVATGEGSRFPSVGNFRLLIGLDPFTAEIVLATARSGDTITVVRGQESTMAQSWVNGTAVTHIVTAGAIEQIRGDGYFHLNILSGLSSNIGISANSFSRIGSIIINPNEYDMSPFIIFESIFEATDGQTAEIRLYNVTDGEIVAGSILTTSSNFSDHKYTNVALPTGLKIYEAQIRITNGSPGVTDGVICSNAKIRIR